MPVGEVVTAHGVRLRVPPNWSAHIFREVPAVPPDEGTGAIVHMGNFAIPVDDAGFGSAMMMSLQPLQIACALVEYIPDATLEPGVGLYAEPYQRITLTLLDFAPDALQVVVPGQLGRQLFFTARNARPFVFYAVLGSEAAATALPALNEAISDIKFASGPEGDDFG